VTLNFTENNKRPYVQKREKVDKLGIFFNLISVIPFLFPVACILVVFLDYDPMYQLFSSDFAHHPCIILLRCIFFAWTSCEASFTVVAAHMVLMALVVHTQSLFQQMKSFKRGIRKPKTDAVFRNRDDIQLYTLACYFLRVANENVDIVLIFTLFPMALMDVTANYAVLKLYAKMPIFIYLLAVLLAFNLPAVFSVEITQAGKTYEKTLECVWGWKGAARSRNSLRFKRALACKPVGYTMGGMFILTNQTITTFGKALLEYTINATLSM
jgi:hypothetical protein